MKRIWGAIMGGATDGTKLVEPDYVATAIEQISQHFADWQPLEGRANHQLWKVLGRIYETSATIDADEKLRETLVAEVRKRRDVRISNIWNPADKASSDLLLTMLLGLSKETKATKSQWLGAVKGAAAAKVEASETAFVRWIESVGGIIAAKKALNGKDAGGTALTDKKLIWSAFRKIIDEQPPAERLTLPLNATSDTHRDLTLVLVRRTAGDDGKWDDQLQVIAKIGAPDLVEKAVAAVQSGRTTNEPRLDLEKIADQCISALIRFPLKEHKLVKGKVKFADQSAFTLACNKLDEHPSLQDKFFDGPIGLRAHTDSSQPDTTKHKFTFDVMNPDFDALDPGKYIKNAKPFALVPYQIVPGDPHASAANYYKWLEDLKERRKIAALHQVAQQLGRQTTAVVGGRTIELG